MGSSQNFNGQWRRNFSLNYQLFALARQRQRAEGWMRGRQQGGKSSGVRLRKVMPTGREPAFIVAAALSRPSPVKRVGLV